MPNKNYQAGYRAEKWEEEYWQDKGYWTMRMYGSKGPFDVIAVHPKGMGVALVEVKTFKNRRQSYKSARNKLRKIPTGPHVKVILAIWGPRVSGQATPRTEEVIK